MMPKAGGQLTVKRHVSHVALCFLVNFCVQWRVAIPQALLSIEHSVMVSSKELKVAFGTAT